VPHRFYTTVALIFGFGFLVVVPPYGNADETAHFYRAWEVSQAIVLPGPVPGTNMHGSVIPLSLSELDPAARLPYQTPLSFPLTSGQLWSVPLDRSRAQLTATPMGDYSPVPYLPQAVVIGILRQLNAPPALMFYLARLAVLLTSVLLFRYAIKLVPFGKWLLAAVGLLPMQVNLNASLAADALTVSLCALLLATAVRIAASKSKPTGRQWAACSGLALAVALCKTAYAPLVFVVFLIPLCGPFVGDRRSAWIKASAIVMAAVLVDVLWTLKTNSWYPVPGPDVSSHAQLHVILHRPAWYVFRVFGLTFLTHFGDGILASFTGAFVALNYSLPNWAQFVAIAMLVLSAALTDSAEERAAVSIRRRYVAPAAFVVGLATIFIIATGEYLTWTNVGATLIQGIQGRYFIPVALLLLLAWPRRLSIAVTDTMTRNAVLMAGMLLPVTVGLADVVYRLYIH
jgi:uncharacterized membrane protein